MMRRGTPVYARLFLGLRGPRRPIPGTGFAGAVESVGGEVRRFRPGDRVFGETGVAFGAHAEYVCVADHGVILAMPDTLSYVEAAPACDGDLFGGILASGGVGSIGVCSIIVSLCRMRCSSRP